MTTADELENVPDFTVRVFPPSGTEWHVPVCSITSDRTVVVLAAVAFGIQPFHSSPSSPSKASSLDTVRQFKEKIERMHGTEANRMLLRKPNTAAPVGPLNLLHSANPGPFLTLLPHLTLFLKLEDDKSLSQCGIVEDSDLHLLVYNPSGALYGRKRRCVALATPSSRSPSPPHPTLPSQPERTAPWLLWTFRPAWASSRAPRPWW